MPFRHFHILIQSGETNEVTSFRIPTALAHFFLYAAVLLVIGSAIAVIWLGQIAIKLQSFELIAEENRVLRQKVQKAKLLQEEITAIVEREKRIESLAQAFLDDPLQASRPSGVAKLGYSAEKREAKVQAVLDFFQQQKTRTGSPSALPEEIPDHLPSAVATTAEWKNRGDFSSAGTAYLAAAGTILQASADGIVTRVDALPRRGYRVVIEHGRGFRTRYEGLEEVFIQSGDFMLRGESIGRLTAPGDAADPSHYRFGVEFRGLAIPPSSILIR